MQSRLIKEENTIFVLLPCFSQKEKVEGKEVLKPLAPLVELDFRFILVIANPDAEVVPVKLVRSWPNSIISKIAFGRTETN